MNSTSRKRSTRPHRKKSTTPKIPYGYCHCGCGKKTKIAPYTSKPRLGWIKGKPIRYINGHHPIQPRAKSRIIFIEGKKCRTISLTRGKEAIIKIRDFKKVSGIMWQARKAENGKYYAVHAGADRFISMHQLLMNAKPPKEVDHINGNGLDNRRPENLRMATRSQNMHNRKPTKGRILPKGVSARRSGFRAAITHNRNQHWLGVFNTVKDAARAYNKAAKILHGDYALINSL